METFSALLAICAGNSPVHGEFPAQRPVARSFDVFFELRLNKQLSKQSWGWWFETLSRPLWRHCNVQCKTTRRYENLFSINASKDFSKYSWLVLQNTYDHHFVTLSHSLSNRCHYNDVIMSAIADQIASLTIVYSTVYSGAKQRKHQSSTSLAFVRGIHKWPVNSPHKGPVTRKMFPFDDVIMIFDWKNDTRRMIEHEQNIFIFYHLATLKWHRKPYF